MVDVWIAVAVLLGGVMGGIISFLGGRYMQNRSFSVDSSLQKSSHGREVERMVLSTIHRLDIEYYHPIIQAARTFASARSLGKAKFSFHWLAVYLARVREFRDDVGALCLKDQTAESVLIYLSDLIDNQIDFVDEEEKNSLVAEVKFEKSHAEFWRKLKKNPLRKLFIKYNSWGEQNLVEMRKYMDCFWRLFLTELRWEFYAPWRGEMISRLEERNFILLGELMGNMRRDKIITDRQEKEFLNRLKALKSY